MNWYKYASPTAFYQLAGKIIPWFAIPATILFVAGLYIGFFVAPTIFDQVQRGTTLAREEVFGPVLALQQARDPEEALQIANDVAFGLAASIYTRDYFQAMRFVERAEVGMLHVNQPTVGGEAQLPFGGIKATGVGEKEMAEEGANFFTHLKTVWLDHTGSKRTSNIY